MVRELDPDNPVKEYTGVWIPKAVMESKALSPIDKLVYGEIACFEECYASNEWLAKRIGRSVTTASRSVSRLIEQGFVKDCGFNGRFRIVSIVKNDKPKQKRQGRLGKNDKAALAKMTSIDKSKDKSIDIVGTKVPMAKEASNDVVIRSQRSLDIDEAFAIWEEVMGYPLHGSTKERQSINALLSRKEMTLDKLRLMVRLIAESQKDKYKRFSIGSYTDLVYKTNDLMAWAKEKQAQQQASTLNTARI